MDNRRCAARGFTLIEISIVIAMMTTLSAISVPVITRVRINSDEAAAQASLSTYRSGMEMFRAINARFPNDLAELSGSTPAYVPAGLADSLHQGYAFLLSNAAANTYTITAVPQQPNVTGVRRFLLTAGGDITTVDATVSAQTVSAANISRRSDGWSTDGKEMWTYWGRKWVEYEVDFGAGGVYAVGLSARNEGGLPPPPPHRNKDDTLTPYRFGVDVYVDGRYYDTVRLDCDNVQYDSQSILVTMPSGKHTVQYRWMNDSYKQGVYDANIRIKEVFFTPQ